MSKKILFISNGHGEDLVAAEIIRNLRLNVSVPKILVLTVVGEGKIFDGLRVQILGPGKKLPSGGFSLRNLTFLMRDLWAGLLGNLIEQIRILKKLQGQIDLTLAIGDLVPIIGALIVKAPFIFVGVNKSDYYHWFGYRYTPWEKWLLKKYAKKIYVRDQLTADNLSWEGIPAEFVGNPLMDCITSPPSVPLSIKDGEGVRIGLLPGTREDARLNLEDFEKVIEELINLKDPATELKFLVATNLSEIPEYMERKPFPELLAESDLIIGLSGTGNEQAAGSGKPVVSFYGRGAQYNKKFAEAQKQLLGDSLLLIKNRDPRIIALQIGQLLKNSDKMEEMGRIGKERLGDGGAVGRITQGLQQML